MGSKMLKKLIGKKFQFESFQQNAPYVIFIIACPLIFIFFAYFCLYIKGFNCWTILACTISSIVIFIAERLLIKTLIESLKDYSLTTTK